MTLLKRAEPTPPPDHDVPDFGVPWGKRVAYHTQAIYEFGRPMIWARVARRQGGKFVLCLEHFGSGMDATQFILEARRLRGEYDTAFEALLAVHRAAELIQEYTHGDTHHDRT